MNDTGLAAVTDPYQLLLGDRRPGVPGSAVLPAMQGQRALLVEVQALTSRTARRTRAGARPRVWTAVGWPCCSPCSSSAPGCRWSAPTSSPRRWVASGCSSPPPTWPWPWPSPRRSPTAPLPPIWWCSARWAWAVRSGRCPTPPGDWPRPRASGSATRVVPAFVSRRAAGHGGRARAVAGPGRRTGDGVRLPSAVSRGAPAPIGLTHRRCPRHDRPGAGDVAPGTPGTMRSVVVRPSSAMADALALVAPGQPLRDGIERVLQANRGLLAGGGRRARGAVDLHRWVPPRRRVQPAAPVGAGQDGRGGHPRPRRRSHRPGQRAPHAQRRHPHHRDRHPAPHRRARGPVHRRARGVGVRRHGPRHRVPPRHAPRPAGRAPAARDGCARPCRRRGASASVSTRPLSRVVRPRDRRHRHGARRGGGAPARRLLDRIADEVQVDLVELGEDGRLLRLQLEEVLDGIDPVRRLVVRDYLHACRRRPRA